MSENAAIVKMFFDAWLIADSMVKTRVGPRRAEPRLQTYFTDFGINAINPWD
jgi:hypothetical protein